MTRSKQLSFVRICCSLCVALLVTATVKADKVEADALDEDRGSLVSYRIQDVRGEDLSDATVSFHLPLQKVTFETKADSSGWASFNWPAEATGTTIIEVTAAKPGYGKTTLSTRNVGMRFNRPENRATWLRMPVPKLGGIDANNALRGRVVGPDGTPIEGVRIIATGIVTPGGREQMIVFPSEFAWTDDQGRFSYIPVKQYQNAGFFFGYFPPQNSSYDVGIYPPPESGLAPFFGTLSNLSEQTITLRASSIQPVFELDDVAGPDLSETPWDTPYLPKYQLFYSEARGDPQHEVRFLTGQAKPMPPGYYTFRTKTALYRRVHLTEDSPKTIAITPHPPTLVTGRVIDPKTGAGLANALVLAISHHDRATINHDHAGFNAELWNQIESLPKQMPQGHTSINNVIRSSMQRVLLDAGRINMQVQPPTAGARSGADGRFALLLPEGVWHDKLVVIAKHRLPWVHRLGWFPDPEISHITLPDTPMYASALIKMKRGSDQSIDERLGWVVAKDRALPAWTKALIAAEENETGPTFDIAAPRKGMISQPLFVPADVQIRLKPYTHNSSFSYEFEQVNVLTLGQGQTITVDQPTKSARRARVQVRVIDADGNHIVGAPIQVYDNTTQSWSQIVNSWRDGIHDKATPFSIDRRAGVIVAIRGEGFPESKSHQVVLEPIPDRPGETWYRYPEVVLTITPEQLKVLQGK